MKQKELINNLVTIVSGFSGQDWKSDYAPHYGGWNLYLVDPVSGGTTRGNLGFNYRKNHKEMQAYLEGLINGLTYSNK